jgi:hypothetical protein
MRGTELPGMGLEASREGDRPKKALRWLVAWLVINFLICAFVALSQPPPSFLLRPWWGARAYLNALGIDQTWPMYADDLWTIYELRITAEDESGRSWDVTQTFLERSWAHRQILDDRMRLAHVLLANARDRRVFEAYAKSLWARLDPRPYRIRFERVEHDLPRERIRTVELAVFDVDTSVKR